MLERDGNHRFVNALAIAAALAAFLCAANHIIVTSVPGAHRHFGSVLMSVIVLPMQVLLVGAVTIREIRPRQLQYYLYGTIIAALELQLFATGVLHPSGERGDTGYLAPAAALVAGQSALVVVGVVFGTGNWRWPLVIGASAWIGFWWLLVAMQRPTASWVQMIFLELAALTALCLQLRGSGFYLLEIGVVPADNERSNRIQVLQFGMRHMLALISVCAVGLGVARAAGMLTVEALLGYRFRDIIFIVSIAMLTAMMLVAVIWATLGQGSTLARASLLVGVLVFTAAGACWYALPLPGANANMLAWRFLGLRWWLWFASAGSVLAALLFFLRGLGFRLVRRTLPRQQLYL